MSYFPTPAYRGWLCLWPRDCTSPNDMSLTYKPMIKLRKLVQVPFILMNSFSTSDDTKNYLSKEHSDLMAEQDVELVQNKSPKVDAKTLEPISWSSNPDMEW